MSTAVQQTSEPAPGASDGTPLLDVENLQKHFPQFSQTIIKRKTAPVRAVDGLTFQVGAGETLGLVGESGCGKSTAGRTVLRLIEPTGGTIRINGEDITHAGAGRLRGLRREMQMVFQDPIGSLNPRHPVGSIIGAPFSIQGTKPEGGVRHEVQQPDGAGRPEPGALQPVSARVLRWAASAHRHRPRHCVAAEADRLRRARLSARCLDPGAGGEPARGSAERVRNGLHLHRPRPVGGAAHLRPGSGDVPGQDDGAHRSGHPLRRTDAPVHAVADVGGAGARPGGQDQARTGSCSSGTCPVRSTHRAAASSTPGARSTAKSSTTRTSSAA